MMRESYEQRRQDAKPVNVHTELLKPLDLLGTKKDNVVKEIGQGEKAMEFRVMLKRGKERQVLLLPTEEPPFLGFWLVFVVTDFLFDLFDL
jgi:hypothetical protein